MGASFLIRSAFSVKANTVTVYALKLKKAKNFYEFIVYFFLKPLTQSVRYGIIIAIN